MFTYSHLNTPINNSVHSCHLFTAPFNNMRTLKFEGQPTNGFFAAVNQVFGGSSQLPTNAEHCFVIWTVLNDLITARSTVVGSWEESPNIWLTVAKNAFVGWALNVRVRMLLKGAVMLIDQVKRPVWIQTDIYRARSIAAFKLLSTANTDYAKYSSFYYM